MNYLLDTNACIALINGKPPKVRARLVTAIAGGEHVLVPSVVAFELWYGVAKSASRESNAAKVREFFAGPLQILPFEEADARRAGELRATLEKVGKPIGAYDLLIASQALRTGLTLVTANAREFGRVKGLAWLDWAKD